MAQMERLTAEEAAKCIDAQEDILLLTHQNPDGDTLGSAFALWRALVTLGKRVRVLCPDPLPQRFAYLYRDYQDETWEPAYIVSVDVASQQLLGSLRESYGGRIDLCIDHHPSNGEFAPKICLRSEAAATCEIIYDIITVLGVPVTAQMATCLYTGIATDTGCFKFSNTTQNTHAVAAQLFGRGADAEFVNEYLFDTKSRARIEIERQALNSVEFFCENRIAVIHISQEMIRSTQIDESELDGVTSIPRMIEGVDIGVTLREKADGLQKVSVRTTAYADASQICAQFGGGGHSRAGGCQLDGDYETAKSAMVRVCQQYLCIEGQP